MKPYLKIIAQTEKPHYLMFYEQGFCPESFKPMHHFDASLEELRELFPASHITHAGNYYIVKSDVA